MPRKGDIEPNEINKAAIVELVQMRDETMLDSSQSAYDASHCGSTTAIAQEN